MLQLFTRGLFTILILTLPFGSQGFAQTFTRITNQPPGIDRGASRSVNWIDVNNDGNPDLFVSNGLEGGQHNVLYINEGPDSGFSFRKVTGDPIVQDGKPSDGSSWGDLDNDGDMDAFVVNWYGDDNLLYRNNGDGTFVQALGEVPVMDGGYSETCSWGDYDSDGDLDLYVTNSGVISIPSRQNFLYQNNGNGLFTRITTGEIVTDASYSRGATWIDYDNDSDLDLFVTNERNQANQLYRNLLVENGSVSFEKILQGDLVTDAASSWSASWNDYDNDGDEDVFIANGWPSAQNDFMYQNNGDGTFTRILTGPVVTDGAFSACGAWGDYDNDGDSDLFVTTAYSGTPTANRLYENQLQETGSAEFVRITV
ncbi:MAG: VCBS repeat-containing protein, partial [Ignavibacteria bacterium]|nr:VCBS repeat-containing protein [Ignavibacteria bacterium]